MIKESSSKRRQVESHERVVVVGNGMVGHRFCRSFRGLNTETPLSVFGKEPIPAYDRVNLSRLVTTPDPNRLLLDPPEWYAEQQIDLYSGTPACSVDPEERTVETESGARYPFDRLVLACGSTPWIPPIPGAGEDRVLVYRTVNDIERIRALAASGKEAAVIGGGLLGLEAAKALHDLGCRVTVIEMADFLMPQQLDWQAGIVLKQEVTQRGIAVQTSSRTMSIDEDGNGRKVLRFETQRNLTCDLVVISAGIRPATEFLEDSGVAMNPNGAVLIDETFQTNIPGVYAIGECAGLNGQVFGLVKPGYQMADQLARNLNGGNERFGAPDLSTRLKVMDIDVSVLGDYLGANPLTHPMTYSKITASGTSRYRKLMVRGRRIKGAIVVGDCEELPAIASAIEQNRTCARRQLTSFQRSGQLFPRHAPPAVLAWTPETQVCNCMAVSKQTITEAIGTGCRTPEAIGERTGAGTVCGSCQPLLADLIGAPHPYRTVPASVYLVLGASLLAIAATLITVLAKPLAYATSVEVYWYQVDQLWRDGWLKQITGYSLFALCLFAMWLSVRKRFKRLRLGRYSTWRAIHTCTGVLTLAALFLHTGFHFGRNFNAWLMSVFALLNLTGGLTGVFSAMEARVVKPSGALARRLKPLIAWSHLICFWPIPLLVLIHIFSVYYW
ncbi:MAG: FAD-dependent oxidoreductase [Verrucomicrobiota bacterium]